MLKEIKNRFLDKNYKKVEKIQLGLSMKEKIMLLLPGFQIYMVKKIIERMENIIKLHTKKEYVSINLWSNNDITGSNLEYEGYFVIGSVSLLGFIGIIIYYLLKLLNIADFDFLLFAGVPSIGFFLGLNSAALSFLFTQKKVEGRLKDYINSKLERDILNTVLNNEDFEKIKAVTDKRTMEDFLINHDFKITYKDTEALEDIISKNVDIENKRKLANDIILSKPESQNIINVPKKEKVA